MTKTLFFYLACFFSAFLTAQDFSGSIEFRYATPKDTSRNVYYVKGDQVRLDQFSRKNDNVVEGSFLFNLNETDVRFLNPKRKLWGVQKSETPQVISGECVVKKGKNVKTLAGYKCNEYVVKNTEENTMITYWIAEDKFTFFQPLIKIWNRKDKQSIYFSQIKNLPPGAMPLMSEEKQLDNGKTISKLEVTKVSKTAPSEEKFNVPKDFNKFDQ
jgi:hypothetical protein